MKYLDIWYPHLQIDFQLVCLHFLTEYILDLRTLVANVLARSALPFLCGLATSLCCGHFE